ncbi:ubiquitin carboxyl-terminal hydrolase 2-like isoform X2 [Bacillus rossius redtenbacheri]
MLEQTGKGLKGLLNIGNTCYMASVIQCLSSTKKLINYILKEDYISELNYSSPMKGDLMKAFSKLIHELWREVGSQASVNPAEFKSVFVRFAPCFKGSSEEDAQECLRYLLAGLHEDVNRAKAKPFRTLLSSEDKLSGLNTAASAWNAYLQVDNSKIVDLFVGQLESMLTCMTCGHHSVTYDPFWDLSLPIPKKMAKVTVKQCLDLFTSEEIMDGKEKPECSVCKKNQKSTKKFLIKKFPQVLVLHLKRFLVNSENNQRAKLTTKVDYKVQNLEMKEYSASSSSSSNCCYDLYAIVTHHGRVNSGHYVAYCQHPFSEQWHSFNDTRVNHLPLEKLVTEDAYLLFYQLKK